MRIRSTWQREKSIIFFANFYCSIVVLQCVVLVSAVHQSEPATYKHMCVLSHSVTSDSATPWAIAHQGPLSMGFSKHEYQSGLPFPPLGDLPDPGIKPMSPVSFALAGRFFTTKI